MKCVCGYEYNRLRCNNGQDDKGDERFIPLDGIRPTIDSIDSTGYRYQINATIYACPKCGTLKI